MQNIFWPIYKLFCNFLLKVWAKISVTIDQSWNFKPSFNPADAWQPKAAHMAFTENKDPKS